MSSGLQANSPTRRRTQAERVARSERRMLGAALRLIAQRGYRGTSLSAIGQEAGYSRGLVNERFGSKAGLLFALVKRMLSEWQNASRALHAPGRTGLDELDDLLDDHYRAVKRRDAPIRAMYALMFESMGPVPELLPDFQTLHCAFRDNIERMLREGVDDGTVRADIDPPAQAALIMGAMRGIAFQYLLDDESFDLAATYRELKQDLRRSLRP